MAITTDILPTSGWQTVNVRELWQSRELLYFLVWRDVKVRYKQTVLGAAWAILQPAMMMVVFTIFLGGMANVPAASDPVFVYAGLLPWTFFATAMANAGNSLVNSERLITKVYFPRLAVPLAAVGAAVVDFAIASSLLVAMMIWRGIVPGAGVLMVPVIFGLLALAAAGVGTLLARADRGLPGLPLHHPVPGAVLAVCDAGRVQPAAADASPWIKALIAVNPISGLIASFRAALFGEPSRGTC